MHFYWMVVIVVIHYNYNCIIITFLTAHLVLTSGWNKSTLVTDLHLYTGQLATLHFTYVYITKEVPIASATHTGQQHILSQVGYTKLSHRGE